ncbi:MAG: glycolate oxidase subunit GlcF [Gammaproteobacteria bacterium]|nr:glycolate oxidase subunit GlcF [Gammaproteobacteria bacterium]
MRTEFTAAQLTDPGLHEANSILRKCVHCGFCNSTCPTFKLLGDELDGPRGRIYLLKNLMEQDETPSGKVVSHIDRCLSCLSCMTTCPSSVNYMHLVDAGRSYIEKKFRRPLRDRLFRRLLAATLPHPARFRLLLLFSMLLLPVRRLLPRRFHGALKLRPPATRNKIIKEDRGQARTGKAVGLVAGCVQQVIGKDINSASMRLLERRGWRVHLLPEPACCGAVEHHLGKQALAEKRFRQNITDWIQQVDEHGLEALIVNASGCGTMLKDYGHLFRHDESLAAAAGRISGMTQDIAEFLSEQQGVTENGEMEQVRVAYQSPCSMQHGQKIDIQPLTLLRQAGFKVQELPEKYMCCGSAGTYNILQPAIAAELGERKAVYIEQANVDVVASGNMACMMHLRQFTDVPFVHTAELLDWATGGPKPF